MVAEAVDRVSRDQADVAVLYKHLKFAGVMIVTLAESEISELHVGLKGTMNALFLKDLAAKTRRGLRGRVEAGRFDAAPVPALKGRVTGDRRAAPAEADVRRVVLDRQHSLAGRARHRVRVAVDRDDALVADPALDGHDRDAGPIRMFAPSSNRWMRTRLTLRDALFRTGIHSTPTWRGIRGTDGLPGSICPVS